MEARHEVMEATWVSQASLALLTYLLARAGKPTPQEDIEVRLDAQTFELAEDLVTRVASATEQFRSERLTGEDVQKQIENLGLVVIPRGSCVCVRDENGPGCCVCHEVALP